MNNKLKLNRDTIKPALGIGLIIIVLILNGFLSFIKFGFDFSALLNGEYWADYFFRLGSGLVIFWGSYIIRKNKNIKDNKVTAIQDELAKNRNMVYNNDKVREAQVWLREYYNYCERLKKYEDKINSEYQKISLIKPDKAEKNYESKLRRYEKDKLKQEYLRKQIALINKDRARLELIIKRDKSEADEIKFKEISDELEDSDYNFKNIKIKYRNIYWSTLSAYGFYETKKEPTGHWSESAELTKEIVPMIGFGMILSALLVSLQPLFAGGVTLATLTNYAITLIFLSGFCLQGFSIADKLILGKYYKALEKRKEIYNQLLKDLDCVEIEWVEEETPEEEIKNDVVNEININNEENKTGQ